MSDHFGEIPISLDPKPSAPKPDKKIPRKPSPAKSIISKRLYLFFLSAAAFFAVYCSIGFFLVPLLTTSQFPDFFFERTGMNVSIQEATFNPLTGTLYLDAVTVNPENKKDTESNLLHLESLAIDLDLTSLLRNGIACNSLKIDKLVASITRFKDKSYNISRLYKNDKYLTPSEIIEFAELPFLFSLNNVSVTNSKVIFDDRLSGKIHRVEDIKLTLPTISNFSFTTDTYIAPSFSALINGSPIELTNETPSSGPSGQQTQLTTLVCDLHSLDLPLYSHYLPAPLPLTITKGRADGKLRLSFQTENKKGRRLTFGFQAILKDVGIESLDSSLSMQSPDVKLIGSYQPFSGNITFSNILLRNPELLVRPNFSNHSLESLLHTGRDIASKKVISSHVPSLVLDLLIADNGVVHIQNGKGEKDNTLHSLQVSIKNFTRNHGLKRKSEKEKGSFRISGELENTASSFSWQGEFMENNRPRGILKLSNLPVSTLLAADNIPSAKDAQGKADLQGMLTIRQNPQDKVPVSYNLTDGTITISDLKLLEKSTEWLHATSVTIRPLSFSETGGDIGNVYLENSTLTLDPNALPSFLKSVAELEHLRLHGIDFSGSVDIYPASPSNPLSLTNVRFQLTNLDKKVGDIENFAATANTKDSAKIKAKGIVTLSPFTASLNLGFLDLEARHVLPIYTDASFAKSGEAKINGKGSFTFPEKVFSGILQVTNATFTDDKQKKSFSWEIAELDKVTITHSPFHADIDKVTLKKLKVQEANFPLFSWESGMFDKVTFSQTPRELRCKKADIEAPLFTLQKHHNTPHIPVKIQQLLATATKQKIGKERAADSTGVTLHFPLIDINQGTVTYEDHRLRPPWKMNIIQLQGEIQNLSNVNAQQATSYDFTGIIGSNPVSLHGSAQFFAEQVTARSVLKTSAFPIASFGEQLPALLDINRNGKFNLILESKWTGGKESGMAQFHFSSVSPASDTSDTSLTLALIADNNYTFPLNVPILNRLGSPLQPLLLKTVGHFAKLMVKASVEPLLLAEAPFKDLVDRQFIAFENGTNILTEEGKVVLVRYRDLLLAHPQLQLILTGMADPENDGNILIKQLEERESKRVEEINLQREKEWRQRNLQKTRTPADGAIVEKAIPPEELTALIPVSPQPVQIDDQDLLNLAGKRAEITKEIMTKKWGLATDRILISRETIIAPPNTPPGNRVNVDLDALPFTDQKDTNKPPISNNQDL